MNYEDVCQKLAILPTRKLVAAMRFMNGGPLGFDYMKSGKGGKFDKQDLIARACQSYLANYIHHIGVSSYVTVWENIETAIGEAPQSYSMTSKPALYVQSGYSLVDYYTLKGTEATQRLASQSSGLSGGGGNTDGGQTDGGNSDGGEGQAGGDSSDGQGDSKDNQSSNSESEGEGEDNKDYSQSDGKISETLADALAKEGKKEKSSKQQKKEDATQPVDRAKIEQMASSIENIIKEEVKKELENRANVYKIQLSVPEEKEEQEPSEEKPRHNIFKEFLEAINAGENVLLVGPSGCGKTHMAREAAKVLGKDFGFTGAVTSEHKLLGYTDAHGRLVRTVYREAYEKGWVFLWDELDASGAQPLLSFNAGLANGHQDFPDGNIQRHSNFRAIASANTYGHGADRQYVGRNQLDAASLDRFYVIPMDYDEELEISLYGDVEWVRYVQAARQAVRSIGMRHVVSMRAIETGLRMLKTKVKRNDVERGALWKHLSADDVKKIKSQMAVKVSEKEERKKAKKVDKIESKDEDWRDARELAAMSYAPQPSVRNDLSLSIEEMMKLKEAYERYQRQRSIYQPDKVWAGNLIYKEEEWK